VTAVKLSLFCTFMNEKETEILPEIVVAAN